MGREHSPRPGVTWQQQPTRVEVVVDEEAWLVTPWKEPAAPGPLEPLEPLNREQRRAAKRAQRRKGRKS